MPCLEDTPSEAGAHAVAGRGAAGNPGTPCFQSCKGKGRDPETCGREVNPQATPEEGEGEVLDAGRRVEWPRKVFAMSLVGFKGLGFRYSVINLR